VYTAPGGAGRGLFATQDLPEGEGVIRDPDTLLFLLQDLLGARDLFRILPQARCLDAGPLRAAVAGAPAPRFIPKVMSIDTHMAVGFLFSRVVAKVGAVEVGPAVPEPRVPGTRFPPEVLDRIRKMVRLMKAEAAAPAPAPAPEHGEALRDAGRILASVVECPPTFEASVLSPADQEWFQTAVVRPDAVLRNNAWQDGLEDFDVPAPAAGFLSAVAAMANHSCTDHNIFFSCLGPLRPMGSDPDTGATAPDQDPDPYHRWGTCVGTTLEAVPRGAQLLACYSTGCDVGRWGITCPATCAGMKAECTATYAAITVDFLSKSAGPGMSGVSTCVKEVSEWLAPLRAAAAHRDRVLDGWGVAAGPE
jgi:hypothetical protein